MPSPLSNLIAISAGSSDDRGFYYYGQRTAQTTTSLLFRFPSFSTHRGAIFRNTRIVADDEHQATAKV